MDLDLYLIFLIPVVVLVVFRYVPMFWTVIAFQDYNLFGGIWKSEWVGLQNFVDLFESRGFAKLLRNTILINLYRIVINFPIPVIFALLLNEVSSRFYKRFVQTVVYLPHFLSWVVVAGLFFNLLMSDGAINQMLVRLGIDEVRFLTSPGWFRPVNVVQGAWKEAGFAAIIYIAAIAGVDPQLYEAAKIDGAGRIRQVLYVTLPGIASTVVLLLLIRIANMMSSMHLLEQILNMYNPAVYETADIIGTYVYRNGLGQLQYSFSAAMDLFSSAIGCILIVLGNWFSKRWTGRSIW